MDTQLDSQKSLQVLINAAQIANTKGAFSLQESKLIAEAVEFFTKPQVQEDKKEKK